MQLEHSFSVPVGIDDAWKILLDIERVGQCMPGAAIDSIDGDEFTGTVKVKLGPINLTYKGRASFLEKDEAARRAVINARGRDARGNGTAAATVTATLKEADGSTTVQVNTDLDITGKPAQFGRGVMIDVGNKLLGQFADALAATIKEGDQVPSAVPGYSTPPVDAAEPAESARPAGPARPKPRRAAASAAQPEDLGAAPAAEPAEDAIPAYSVPGGVPTAAQPAGTNAVNGHAAEEATRPDRPDTEHIDLLKAAGPAVLKRLAGPVAVAIVLVLLAARRRHRR